VKALVDELRARMADELDYRLEARFQTEFAERYEGHPFFRIPKVVPERVVAAGADQRLGRGPALETCSSETGEPRGPPTGG